MAKRYQLSITICLVLVMLLSCFRCDSTFLSVTEVAKHMDTISVADSSISEIKAGYTRLDQQDYWNTESAIRLSSSFLKRTQHGYRSHIKRDVLYSELCNSFNLVLFSFILILVAAGGTGLSMPFRCLLYYIHNTDGKKRYC